MQTFKQGRDNPIEATYTKYEKLKNKCRKNEKNVQGLRK